MSTTIEKNEIEKGTKTNLDALREKLRMAKESKEEKFVKEEDLIAEAVEMVRGNKKLNQNFLQKEKEFSKNSDAPEAKPRGYHDNEKKIEEEKFALIDKLMGESAAQLNQYNEAKNEALAALHDEHISAEDKIEIEKLLEEIEPAIIEETSNYSKLQQQQFDRKKEKDQNQERRVKIDTKQQDASFEPEKLAVRTVLDVYKNSGKLINTEGKSDLDFRSDLLKKVKDGVRDVEEKEYREEQNKKQQEYNEQQKKKQEEADLGLDKWKIESEVLYNKYKAEFDQEIEKIKTDFDTVVANLPEDISVKKVQELKDTVAKELKKKEGFGAKIVGWKPGKYNDATRNLRDIQSERWKAISNLKDRLEISSRKMRIITWELFSSDGSHTDEAPKDVKKCEHERFVSSLNASTNKLNECAKKNEEASKIVAEINKTYKDVYNTLSSFAEDSITAI